MKAHSGLFLDSRRASMKLLHRLLTVKEVSLYLKLNPLTVYEYIRSGKLQAVKLGRYYRISEEDLTVFLNANRTEVTYG